MLSQSYIHSIAILTTLVIEGSGMIIFSISDNRYRKLVFRNFFIAIFVNVISHTVFWYVLPFITFSYPFQLIGLEMIIVIVEGKCYEIFCELSIWPAIGLSAGLNLMSFLGGVWVYGQILEVT